MSLNIRTRLIYLERIAEKATPPIPGMVIFCKGESPMLDERQQIEQAEANGQHAVVFTVIPAGI